MKILLYSLNYAPELTGIGKYSGEMAVWLAARGHDVRVLTTPPYYPEWRVHDGYRAGAYTQDEVDGVTVLRCPLWVPAKVSGAKRIVHLLSFAASSALRLPGLWRWKPDLVWVVEPAFACAPAALAFARLRGARAWLHIQDYEIDAAFQLGQLKGEGLRRLVHGVERWLMRRFDRVSTISQRMVELGLRKGVSAEAMALHPNWVDVQAIRPLAQPSRYRAELGLAPDTVVALYSGNMGGKQGLETLAEAARQLAGNPQVHFVLCGQGAGREKLEQACAGLANVSFLPLQPLERLGELLGLADIHLLPQRADAADLVMPSKLTGMLSSGRAVIAMAQPGTELGDVVAQCGRIVPPEDAAALVQAIEALAADPALRDEMGRHARAHAENHMARDPVLGRFEADALALCRQGVPAEGVRTLSR